MIDQVTRFKYSCMLESLGLITRIALTAQRVVNIMRVEILECFLLGSHTLSKPL